MPQCDKLTDSALRAAARSRVAEIIVSFYTSLYDAILDPKNKYEDPRAIVHYRPEQIKTVVDAL